MEFSIPVAGDVAVLSDLPEHFRIGLGCVDVRFPEIDSSEQIVERVDKALQHIAAPRITLSPDCGFSPGKDHGIPLDESFEKLKSLSAAARLLRERT